MSKWAGVKNGVVRTVALAEREPPLGRLDAWVELPPRSYVGPGWTYDGTTFTAPPELPKPTTISRDEFLDRFTDGELAEITHRRRFRRDTANQLIPYPQWRALEVSQWRIEASENINLANPRVVSYVEALEDIGLIGAGRAVEILTP